MSRACDPRRWTRSLPSCPSAPPAHGEKRDHRYAGNWGALEASLTHRLPDRKCNEAPAADQTEFAALNTPTCPAWPLPCRGGLWQPSTAHLCQHSIPARAHQGGNKSGPNGSKREGPGTVHSNGTLLSPPREVGMYLSMEEPAQCGTGNEASPTQHWRRLDEPPEWQRPQSDAHNPNSASRASSTCSRARKGQDAVGTRGRGKLETEVHAC